MPEKRSTARAQANEYRAIGRRKTAVARVIMRPGKGNITVNRRSLEEYFSRPTARMVACQWREHLPEPKLADSFDMIVTVYGGGSTGQAGAIRLAIARALVEHDEEGGSGGDGELSLRKDFRKANLLTRDARKVERKKVGLRKARKKTQYSKR